VTLVAVLLSLVVLGAVVWFVSGPLVRGRDPVAGPQGSDDEALEAEKEAKYREIREAELDLHTGKLSEADWRALDAGLRAEAAELLRRAEASAAEGNPPPPAA